jgi:Fur family peroxide stress response transcriptional regulator
MNKMNEKGPLPKATRRTPQKMAIEAYLDGNGDHPSAEEIHRALRPRFPMMSLSTVYNVLRGLQQEGRIHELAVDCGRARFDPEPRPHHHLVCLECRAVADLDRDFDLSLAPGESRGFRVLHGHVGLYGICPDCQTRRKAKS